MTSSPPDRTLHCFRHDQAYVGRCDGCVTGDPPVLNQRPESYSTKGPAVAGKSWDEARAESEEWCAPKEIKLSVEQVHAQLRKRAAECPVEVRILIGQLPRVDVVEGCCKAHDEAYSMDRCGDPRTWMRAAIRRYLELRGLPTDPDLEGE